MFSVNILKSLEQNWPVLSNANIAELGQGNINQTFVVTKQAGEKVILQKVSPLFAMNLHGDIDALHGHLEKNGLLTPRLIKTAKGKLASEIEGSIFRLYTYIEGEVFEKVSNNLMAYAAGHLVGEFHLALESFEHVYAFQRPQAHNTQNYLEKFHKALMVHKGHEAFTDVKTLAKQIFKHENKLVNFSKWPAVHCHGDLKITNLIFDGAGRAKCLIDFDTIGKLPWPLEMADALRSWCNLEGEESAASHLDLSLLEAALKGCAQSYAQQNKKPMFEGLYDALFAITVELSVRFATDALEGNYFNADLEKYGSHAKHLLMRAQGQWSLHNEVVQNKRAIKEIIERVS